MQRRSGLAAVLVAVLVICSAPVPVALVASAKDTSNRFPETGAIIIWAGPNAAGMPEGLRAICSGALIHERAFLTSGHCIGPGVSGIPPFIQVAVSFDPANAFDRASWVPVTRLVMHPSLPEACLSAPGCNPTSTSVFPAGDPARADVGLAILARPVRHIRPATFARPGALTDPRVAKLPMTVVGYGSTKPILRDPPPPASTWDGSRRFRTSALQRALNDYWGMWSLPSRVCRGDSGAPTFVDDAREKPARRLVAVVSDGGKDCASTDARVRVDTAAMQEWIARVIHEEAGQHSSASVAGRQASGQFLFIDPGTSHPITVWFCRASAIRSDTRIVFVMHGSESQTARQACDIASPYIQAHEAIVLAPQFAEEYYPGDAYMFGT